MGVTVTAISSSRKHLPWNGWAVLAAPPQLLADPNWPPRWSMRSRGLAGRAGHCARLRERFTSRMRPYVVSYETPRAPRRWRDHEGVGADYTYNARTALAEETNDARTPWGVCRSIRSFGSPRIRRGLGRRRWRRPHQAAAIARPLRFACIETHLGCQGSTR